MYFSENYKGEVEFSQHLIRLHEKVPQEHIDEIRPVMVKVETALERQCGISQLSEQIEEHCSGRNASRCRLAAQHGAAADRAPARSVRRL